MESNAPLFPLIFAVVVFVGFWLGIIALISVMGGWNRLYKLQLNIYDLGRVVRTFSFCSLRVGMSSYRNSINVNVYEQGIEISPFFMFKFMHKPIKIAWENISNIERSTSFFITSTRIQLHGKTISFYGKSGDYVFETYNYYANNTDIDEDVFL